MNIKTTIALAIVLIVVVGALWLAGGNEPEPVEPPDRTTKTLESIDLIEQGTFEEPVRIVCKRRDSNEWVFVRGENKDRLDRVQWRIAEPIDAPASGWQVDGIARRLRQLKYQVKLPVGEGAALTLEEAGFAPPLYEVTLEDEEGASLTVQIGDEYADNQTYVRLDGEGDAYVVQSRLDNLLKDEVIAYRDLRLLDFAEKNAQRLEITERPQDGEPATYVLVRAPEGWTLEQPVKARAATEKIKEVVSTLSRIGVTGWVEDHAENLAVYGLEDPALTVNVTVEEPAEAEDRDAADEGDQAEEDPAPPPEPGERRFTIHIASRSPIGEPTKVYARMDGEHMVGTMAKSQTDKLQPDLGAWREMRLVPESLTAADRIELSTPQGQAVFVRQGAGWQAEEADFRVDSAAVGELLSQLGALEAQGFVDEEPGDETDYGFEEPQASISLNIPGRPEPLRITVGAYTDAERQRLVYVRRGDGAQVAKVRVADIEKMVRPPAQYRDRTVLDLKTDRIQRVSVTRPHVLTGEPFSFVLTRGDGGGLQIAEPTSVPTAQDEVTQLLGTLSGLTAVRVLPASDPEAYGLESPAAQVSLTYSPPEITRYVQVPEGTEEEEGEDEPATAPAEGEESEGDEADPPKLKRETYQPPAEEYALLVGEQEGKVYAALAGADVVYELPGRVLELLRAEYHTPDILEFEASQVQSMRIEQAGQPPHEFARVDGQWQYLPEPELPLDPKRVQDLLLRLNDLSTERYVTYEATDPAEYGLDDPQDKVTVRLQDGAEQTLIVSAQVAEQDPAKRHFAALANAGGVFLVSQDTIDRFAVDLTEYEAR